MPSSEGSKNPRRSGESPPVLTQEDFACWPRCIGDNLMEVTWKTLTELLSREFRNLRRIPVVSFGFAAAPVTDANELKQEELRWGPRVDTIVRDFAKTRRWPALDERERFFLRERIRFAYEYASLAEISVGRPLTIATRKQVLDEQRRLVEWLLIDVWRHSGVENWLEPFFLLTQAHVTTDAPWSLQISA